MDNQIALNKCDSYDLYKIMDIFRTQLINLSISPDFFKDKKVVVKPNLVINYGSDKAATTHPLLVEAVCRIAAEYGAKCVTIAESSGGPYIPSRLNQIYKTCGISDAAANSGAILNFDVSFRQLAAPDSKLSKVFNIITPICDSDIIINVCKLKTHSLAVMTAAVKNFFGVIPGVQKIELHARFKKHDDFFNMLVDLCLAVTNLKPSISIVDAVVGMEGNGPSGGSPRKIGCILMAKNPFALDLACSHIINASGIVPTVNISAERLLSPADFDDLSVFSDHPISTFLIPDYKLSDSSSGKLFKIIPSFIRSHPKVNLSKCIGCGDCIKNCPVKTIVRRPIDNKAHIILKNCIRCYCCQELCTLKAVDIKKSFIYNILK